MKPINHPTEKKSKNWVRLFWKYYFITAGVILMFLLLLNFGWIGGMPDLDDIENPTASLASQVYAQDGTPMGKYYLEDRISVKYRDISPYLIQALVATEDKRFYDHYGIDGEGLVRAVAFLGSKGGASTISMQTAKNLFTNNWGTKNKLLRVIQKIKESIIAIKLERNFTKQEILTLYLNTVPFSDNLFGVSNASRTFFQKEQDRLSVEEAALLIGMINAPTKYNPNRNPKLALERRNLVINRMAEQKYISDDQAAQYKELPIVTNYRKLDENNGFGDIAAINAFQRMVDPGVAVREGDVALLQTAIPRLKRLGLTVTNLVDGDRLTQEARDEIKKLANALAKTRINLGKQSILDLRQTAKLNKIDPDLVIREFSIAPSKSELTKTIQVLEEKMRKIPKSQSNDPAAIEMINTRNSLKKQLLQAK